MEIWYPKINDNAKIIKNNIFSSVYFNNASILPVSKNINIKSLKTIKIKFYPNSKQKNQLNKWYDLVSQLYNEINDYIKIVICKPNYYLDKKNIIQCSYTFINDKKLINYILNWKNIRNMFTNEIDDLISDNIYRHTLDYSVKLCLEMYKSAYSNFKAGNIKNFNIRNLNPDRVRKNFVIEPSNFTKQPNKNGFCIKHFGNIKSDKELNKLNIKHNVIVQYNSNTNKYYFLIPIDETINKTIYREKKCGIDIGVRVFQTIYSENKCYEIGKGITKKIDIYNKKLDSINSRKEKKELSIKKANKARKKYQLRLTNLIDDLHKKTCCLLFKNYDIINIGKVSIKSMISNLKGNIKEKTKRRLIGLKHYKFREYLLLNAPRYDVKVNLVSEYLTSQKCFRCLDINKVGSLEKYNCKNCKLEIGRDINASINIYKK